MKQLLSLALCLLCAHVALATSVPSTTNPAHDSLGVDDCDLNNTEHVTVLFAHWQQKHGFNFNKTKNATEHHNAYTNFHASATRVQKSRAEYFSGNCTSVAGLNQFSHWSPEEFQAHLSRKPRPSSRTRRALVGRPHRLPSVAPTTTTAPPTRRTTPHLTPPSNKPSPNVAPNSSLINGGASNPSTYLNYANEGVVTPVKDQGQCGCCWAFAGAECIEGAYAKANKRLISFSEQELVNCVDGYSRGCGGGIETDVYDYVRSNGGMDTESSYPYTSANGRATGGCKSSAASGGKVTFNLDCNAVPYGDAALKAALIAIGPIDCGIGVSNGFQDYSGGIMSATTACLPQRYINAGNLNHAVLLVGYDSAANCWIFKNSWGVSWGENGYFRLAVGTGNTCGISSDANSCIVS